jgi:hypothetical protein
MVALPNLIRTKKTKTNNEVTIWANLDVGRVVSTSIYISGQNRTTAFTHASCCTDLLGVCGCPVGSFAATVNMCKNVSAIGLLPPASPIFAAVEGTSPPGAEGDMVYNICLPNPANDFLICFDQGAAPSPGLSYKPIPLKYDPVSHYVRQRPENTITLSDLFVADRSGLQRIRGIPVTIIIKVSPDGCGVFQEIQYYSNVILNPKPMNSAADGNASIEISMEGPFSFCAIFSGAGGGILVPP